MRSLIKRYNLEPAGSHGVWGLDDHSFIPYIFGSAQLSPAISETDKTPEEGSLPDAPSPGSVAKAPIVERERRTNMYFSAIGFIYDVKKGPFWEHSPMLYDISGIPAGWGKINKVSFSNHAEGFIRIDSSRTQGMIKMYNAEVLSKFPVVQHFPLGSLFSWDRDPQAATPPTSRHTMSGLSTRSPEAAGHLNAEPGTKSLWTAAGASSAVPPMGMTPAPWAATRVEEAEAPGASTRLPTALTDTSRLPPGPMAPTRAPFAKPEAAQSSSAVDSAYVTTKAPRAKRQ